MIPQRLGIKKSLLKSSSFHIISTASKGQLIDLPDIQLMVSVTKKNQAWNQVVKAWGKRKNYPRVGSVAKRDDHGDCKCMFVFIFYVVYSIFQHN